MFKKFLLALMAASLISIAAAGQDAPANNQPAAPSAQGNEGWHHGPPDPAQRTKMLTKRLNLSADQQTKVQGIFQTEQSQMQGLREDTTLSRQDLRTKMMDMRKSTDAQVRAVLDPEQQKKWDEMQAKREQWGEHRRHGDSGDQAPPPSQQ
jgi:periplasmic protein CpxP/Spy